MSEESEARGEEKGGTEMERDESKTLPTRFDRRVTISGRGLRKKTYQKLNIVISSGLYCDVSADDWLHV